MAATSASGFSYRDDQLRKYEFPTEPIPRVSVSDPKADDYISSGQPVIFTDSNLVTPAVKKWNLDYLQANFGSGDYSVYLSKDHRFKYFDEKKSSELKQFRNPMKRVEMKFPDFVTRIRAAKPDDTPRMYLQQSLNAGVGQQIVFDFLGFNWAWVTKYQQENNWGPLTSNLLLISQEGNITPVHYDEQENFFTQVTGGKRVLLFDPSQFECLYPYPVHHPHDRQSQVDFEKPDYQRFPKLRNLKGYEAVLEPGEVLYLPMYWWHQFESLMDGGITTSITFWYKAGETTKDISYPLKSTQKMAMKRNIEKMLFNALGSQEEMYPFMQNMVLGRYTEDVEESQLVS